MWEGSFGDHYTVRNRVGWEKRVPFWHDVLARTKAQSIIEFGCNAGWNLRAIREVDPTLRTFGVDVNHTALAEAREAGLAVDEWDVRDPLCTGGFDLAFTSGVLIHLDAKAVERAMKVVMMASCRWVLAVEYAAEEEVMVPYRGYTDALWKRPFGKMYEGLGLRLVHTSHAPGFDDCTGWLLRWN